MSAFTAAGSPARSGRPVPGVPAPRCGPMTGRSRCGSSQHGNDLLDRKLALLVHRPGLPALPHRQLERPPPTRPWARAAVNPATVGPGRSPARTGPAPRTGGTPADPRQWSCRCSPATTGTPPPRPANPVTTSIRCRSDRPRRSSRHPTNVSPGRNCSNTSSSCGRRSNAHDAQSVHTFQHPAAATRQTCGSGFCLVADTA
jgi:hypothetical protein